MGIIFSPPLPNRATRNQWNDVRSNRRTERNDEHERPGKERDVGESDEREHVAKEIPSSNVS